MDRDEAIAKLNDHAAELKQLSIDHRYLFGSTARGEAAPNRTSICFSITPAGSSACSS